MSHLHFVPFVMHFLFLCVCASCCSMWSILLFGCYFVIRLSVSFGLYLCLAVGLCVVFIFCYFVYGVLCQSSGGCSGALKYALRVTPAVTMLTVYRRLRVETQYVIKMMA